MELPYDPEVPALYTPRQLLSAANGPETALDARIYKHFLDRGGRTPDPAEARSQRVHDLSIERARDQWLGDRLERHVVGVMGGHDLKRGSDGYRVAAELGRSLAGAGKLVVTGGGPGAMEAANLGAFLADVDEAQFEQAVSDLGEQPDWHEPGYARIALEVLERHQTDGHENLSIPTWYYGFEPSNPFATRIAKYFSNSLREDGLITIALDGVVYLAGRAGTVQEVFQDAAQNYYGADYGRSPWVSPMVFLKSSDPEEQALVDQVFALVGELASLARQKNPLFAQALTLVPDVDSAVDFIHAHPPQQMPTP